MDLDWLETFLAVVDRGGFTAASRHVHRSQSRVSAHVAGLERELGVRLLERDRRPTAPTPAGEVFVEHARGIVTAVASARAAVGALRDLEDNDLTLVTTPCIGAALFPGVLARLTGELRGARIDLAEQSWRDVGRRIVTEGAALAVLPVLDPVLAGGLTHQVLWRERLFAVVGERHELAGSTGGVCLEQVTRHPLLICRAAMEGEPEAVRLLGARGVLARSRVSVDSPQTLVSLARTGAGVGILNAVALRPLDLTGVHVRELAEPGLVREVAAYWSDVLLRSETGRRLHRAVLEAPLPEGAEPVDRKR